MIDSDREIREGWIHEFHSARTEGLMRRPRLYYIPVIIDNRAIVYTEDGMDEVQHLRLDGKEIKNYSKIIPVKKFSQPEPRIGQDEYLKRMGIR